MKTVGFIRGGVHPLRNQHEGKRLSGGTPIQEMPVPQKLYISLSQGAGAPSKPVVKVSDTVYAGQLLAEPAGAIGNRVHASTSGVIRGIVDMPNFQGIMVPHIVLDSDGEDRGIEAFAKNSAFDAEISGKDIMQRIVDAGLVGMGGAGFPTYVKMNTPDEKKVEALIINGAECEPFLTSDQRLMEEQPERILRGVAYAVRATNAEKAYIGIETNKPEAIKAMAAAAAGYDNIEVIAVRTKYPQGAEKQMIDAIIKREVPRGGLPIDVGVVVLNVGTCGSICDAVEKNMPLIRRVVSVTGSVGTPKNILARIGTTFADVIAFCGGYSDDAVKLIAGGPMMGFAQFTDQVSITKGTSGIVVLNDKVSKKYDEQPCIRCGKCIEACPMRLEPLLIDGKSRLGKYDEADALHAADCVECGACAYICPSKRHLVQSIVTAKREIIAARKKGMK